MSDQASNIANSITKVLKEKIAALTGAVSDSVMAVAKAFSLHADDMADAYLQKCPDQGVDVDGLELDVNYVILLDHLRRTRPDAYALLLKVAVEWHEHTPLLYKQPVIMAELANHIVGRLVGMSSVPGSCAASVAAAAAAALSSATAPPSLLESEEEAAEQESAELTPSDV